MVELMRKLLIMLILSGLSVGCGGPSVRVPNPDLAADPALKNEIIRKMIPEIAAATTVTICTYNFDQKRDIRHEHEYQENLVNGLVKIIETRGLQDLFEDDTETAKISSVKVSHNRSDLTKSEYRCDVQLHINMDQFVMEILERNDEEARLKYSAKVNAVLATDSGEIGVTAGRSTLGYTIQCEPSDDVDAILLRQLNQGLLRTFAGSISRAR